MLAAAPAECARASASAGRRSSSPSCSCPSRWGRAARRPRRAGGRASTDSGPPESRDSVLVASTTSSIGCPLDTGADGSLEAAYALNLVDRSDLVPVICHAGHRSRRSGTAQAPSVTITINAHTARNASNSIRRSSTRSVANALLHTIEPPRPSARPRPTWTAARRRISAHTLPRARAERHPDAELLRALVDRVRRHCVQPDDRNEDGNQRQSGDQTMRDAAVPLRVLDRLRHRRDPVERQRGIDGHHLLPKQRASHLRIQRAAHKNRHRGWRGGAKRRVDHGFGGRVPLPDVLRRRPRSSAMATSRSCPLAGARRTRRPIGSRSSRCTSTNRWLTIADSRPGRPSSAEKSRPSRSGREKTAK